MTFLAFIMPVIILNITGPIDINVSKKFSRKNWQKIKYCSLGLNSFRKFLRNNQCLGVWKVAYQRFNIIA